MEDTTKFPSGLGTISYTSFPMINCYSLIIASSIDGRACINYVNQLSHTTRVYLRPLTLVGSPIIILFILNYISCPIWYSSLMVDLPLSLGHIMILIFIWSSFFCHGVSDHGSSRFIFMYIYWNESSRWTIVTCSFEQVSSLFSCRWLYMIFSTTQINKLHGYKHFIIFKTYS